MKPFNLKKALAGQPVVTRNGKEVKDLRIRSDSPNDLYPVEGIHEVYRLLFWTKKGVHFVSHKTNIDLFMKSKPINKTMKKQSKAEKLRSLLVAGKKVSQNTVKFNNPNCLSAQISVFRREGMNVIFQDGRYLLGKKKK